MVGLLTAAVSFPAVGDGAASTAEESGRPPLRSRSTRRNSGEVVTVVDVRPSTGGTVIALGRRAVPTQLRGGGGVPVVVALAGGPHESNSESRES